MSDQIIVLLTIPLFLSILAALWVLMRISRHSRFSFKVSGLGVKVELTGGTNRAAKDRQVMEANNETAD